MEFSSNPNTKKPQYSISTHPFFDVPSQEYLNPPVRINKLVKKATLVCQDWPQGCILLYFFKLLRVLYLHNVY